MHVERAETADGAFDCPAFFCRTNRQALAYLPGGSLERWTKPRITIVLVHARGEAAGRLSQTLLSLSEAHYVGDSVDLRLVLNSDDAGEPMVRESAILFLASWP